MTLQGWTGPYSSGLQHERTALAWERTSVAMMVAGMLLARYASDDGHWVVALLGLAHTAIGAGMLVWTGYNYDNLHGPLRAGEDIVHPTATRLVGLATISLTGSATILAVVLTAT